MAKKNSKKKSKKRSRKHNARVDLHIDFDDTDHIDESYIETNLYTCLGEDCRKPGIHKAWCSQTCWGTFYCSQECFEKDVESGLHAKICRYTEGQDNFEIKQVPDNRYAKTCKKHENGYKHQGLYAKRSIKRGEIVAKQVPFIHRNTSTLLNERERKNMNLDLDTTIRLARGAHVKETLGQDHPFYYSATKDIYDPLENMVEKAGTHKDGEHIDKSEDPENSFTRNEIYYIYDVLLNWDHARVVKWCYPRVRSSGWMSYLFSESFTGEDKSIQDKIHHLLSLSIAEMTVRGRESLNQDTIGLYCYGLMGYINHACSPNVAYEQIGDVLNIYALRNIEPGEELVLMYLHVEHIVRLSKRRHYIKKLFNIRCVCETCSQDQIPMGLLVSIQSACNEHNVPLREEDSNFYSIERRCAYMERISETTSEIFRWKIIKDKPLRHNIGLNDDEIPTSDVVAMGIDDCFEAEMKVPRKDYPCHAMNYLASPSANKRVSYITKEGAPAYLHKGCDEILLHMKGLILKNKINMFCTMLVSIQEDEHVATFKDANKLDALRLSLRRVMYLNEGPSTEITSYKHRNLATVKNLVDGPMLFCVPSLKLIDPILKIWIQTIKTPNFKTEFDLAVKDSNIGLQLRRMETCIQQCTYPGYTAELFFARFNNVPILQYITHLFVNKTQKEKSIDEKFWKPIF